MTAIDVDKAEVEADIRRWVERAVIGLNLCPFAKSVYARHQVRIVISDADNLDDLGAELGEELLRLRDAPPERIDTTLLVLPRVLRDFLDYNDYLDEADALLGALGLDGVLQVASFHPDYRFAGSLPDDPGNNTNRAPWPVLHLLREESIDRAVAAYPAPDAIIARNLAAMDELGNAGYRALLAKR
ncbi:DUF1415 domain-containing protein [Lysobacter pythonis]|uniref:DUF1415 domain-containing protein n=1 Tax=Solilutibacter pythonis TaxID=2483112 RepID=A0A3M2HST6_9GAMM|nr:DUF1415 domain-containing protein [Lysobacter pythonis]RMH92826.1 DUF1415 domain-containing protein [Lysobacter pythonis]